LFAGEVITHLSAEIYSIGDPTFYLIAPLLWFYTRELTGERVEWRFPLLLHFLPFFLIIVFSLSFRSVNSASFLSLLERQHRFITILFWITIVVQFSWYQVLVHRRWLAYQTLIEQEVSSTENVSISWVRFFMIVFLLINLLFLFSLFAAIHLKDGSWLPKATALMFSLSIFALGFKGILQKDVFQNGEAKIIVDKEVKAETLREKPDRSKLDQLTRFMEENRPYLDAELTLTELAKRLTMTRGQLSALINEGTGNNFYDFVNKYRVEEVKRLMVDPTKKNFNMLGLALDAGFKSKSTFNLIFKRFTGLTPSEYRKNILN
jgi:AraC-like DNA-binding protein